MSGVMATVDAFESMADEFDLDLRLGSATFQVGNSIVNTGTNASCPVTCSYGYTCSTCQSCGCPPTQMVDSHCPCRPA